MNRGRTAHKQWLQIKWRVCSSTTKRYQWKATANQTLWLYLFITNHVIQEIQIATVSWSWIGNITSIVIVWTQSEKPISPKNSITLEVYFLAVSFHAITIFIIQKISIFFLASHLLIRSCYRVLSFRFHSCHERGIDLTINRLNCIMKYFNWTTMSRTTFWPTKYSRYEEFQFLLFFIHTNFSLFHSLILRPYPFSPNFATLS